MASYVHHPENEVSTQTIIKKDCFHSASLPSPELPGVPRTMTGRGWCAATAGGSTVRTAAVPRLVLGREGLTLR